VTGRKDDARRYQRIMDVRVALALPVCAHPLRRRDMAREFGRVVNDR
jgi:hypothetical protein